MNRIIHISPNMSALGQAIGAVCGAVDACNKAEASKREETVRNRMTGGAADDSRLLRKLEELTAGAEKAVRTARESFERWCGDFHVSIANAAYPAAGNIKDELPRLELLLLEKQYIQAPEELEEMRRRCMKPINPTLLRAIEAYAEDEFREWPGFEFCTDAREYLRAESELRRLAAAAFKDPSSEEAQTIMRFKIPGQTTGSWREFMIYIREQDDR